MRAKRKAQAESVAGLLQELQTENPGTAVISIGDYNAYQFSDGYTDPIATLKGNPTPDDEIVVDASPDLVNPNFVNLTDDLPPAEQYSFIFEGTPQALDHVLVNTVAASYVQRYAIARGNADFPELPAALFAANPDRPERASDHDMPVAYFRFPPPSADVAVTVSAEPATAAVGANVTYTIVVTNNGISPAQNVVVTETLPALLTFVSCSATGDGVCGGTCDGADGKLRVARAGRIGNDHDRRRRQLRGAERRVAGSQRQRGVDDRRSRRRPTTQRQPPSSRRTRRPRSAPHRQIRRSC